MGMRYELNHKPSLRVVEKCDKVKSLNELALLDAKGELPIAHQFIEADKMTSQSSTLAPDFYQNAQDIIANGDPSAVKVWYDFSLTLKEVPLVYKQIYQTLSDRSLPELIPVKDFAPKSDFFFSQVLDGEAVMLNEIKQEGMTSVSLQINAGGYIKSFREMLFDNSLKEATMRDQAARGYRNYLNAVYMNPIVSFTGTVKDTLFDVSCIKTTPKSTMSWFEKNWHIVKAGINRAKKWNVDNQLNAQFVAVMNEETESWFQDATDEVNPDGNKRYPSLTNFMRSRVIYNGASMKDGDKPVVYTGCATGTIFLVPIGVKHFVEFEKVPLTVITDEGLANNLGAKTTVMYDCRGQYASTDGIIRINLIPLLDSANADSPMG